MRLDDRLAAGFSPGPAGGDRAVVLLHGFLSDRRAGGRFDRLTLEYRLRPKLGSGGTQAELLEPVKVPVLVVHGDTGEQEQRLAAITAEGAHLLPPGSRVAIIPGATHTFHESQDALAGVVTTWISALSGEDHR